MTMNPTGVCMSKQQQQNTLTTLSNYLVYKLLRCRCSWHQGQLHEPLGVLTCQVWRWRGSSHSLELRLRSPAVLPLSLSSAWRLHCHQASGFESSSFESFGLHKTEGKACRVSLEYSVPELCLIGKIEKRHATGKNGWNSPMSWIGISRLEVAWKSLGD